MRRSPTAAAAAPLDARRILRRCAHAWYLQGFVAFAKGRRDERAAAGTPPRGAASATTGCSRASPNRRPRSRSGGLRAPLLRIFDITLANRGFNSPARIEQLRQFLVAGRAHRLMIALHETDPLERDCPRLIALLRQFPMSIEIHRTLAQARNAADPCRRSPTTHSVWAPDALPAAARRIVALHSPSDAMPIAQRFGRGSGTFRSPRCRRRKLGALKRARVPSTIARWPDRIAAVAAFPLMADSRPVPQGTLQ
jgi:hypothetical protein